MKVLYFLRLVIRLQYVKSVHIASGVFLCLCNCTVGSGRPDVVVEQQKDNILIEHFWDTYDFTDTVRVNRLKVTEKILVDYLIQLSRQTEEKACESVRKLVAKSKADDSVNRWLLQRLEHHLYEPDSPLRNDNYYISVLEEALISGHLNGMMRVRPLYQLKMLKKNRVGDIAADFSFTLPAGEVQNLWDISTEYTLLLFYDPDCMHCRNDIQQLSDSPAINTLLQHCESASPQLALVAICTESDKDMWREYQKTLPSTWINGYDAKRVLIEKELYFLRSLPSIYLLGEGKQVLLKEPSSISEVTNYLMNIMNISCCEAPHFPKGSYPLPLSEDSD